jgi:hypothetical protein
MPTKRTILDRPRRPTFSRETLALFIELDATPARSRNSEDFKTKERQLARQLDLIDEWWTTNTVLDRSRAPCWPPGHHACKDWARCREARKQLLAAAGKGT